MLRLSCCEPLSSLDDVRAKLRRAREHQDAGFGKLAEWADGDPYRVVGRAEEDEFVLYLEERHPPPVDLALIYADFIHNLRASLDLLACSLVEANGQTVDERNGFPVVKRAEDWMAAVGSK